MMAKNLDAAVAIDSEIKTTLGGSPETALLPVAVEPIAANPGDQPPANGKLKAERTKLNKLLPQKPWINIGNIPWVLEFSEGGKVLYYTAGFKDKATKGTYTWTADNALHIDSDGDGKPDMATQPTNIGNDTLNMYTISGEHRGRLMHERKGVKLEK